MGFKALHIMLFILMCGSMENAFAQAQNSLLSNKGTFQLFSNQYSFQDDLLADVQPGQLGAVWRARMYGEAVEFESQSAQIGTVDFFVESKYKMLQNLEALVFFRAKFAAGRSQDFYGDLEPDSGVLLREGSLKYTPFEFLNVKAGIINQDWLNNPQLVWRQSFPGASIRLSNKFTDTFELAFTSQYLIPTSQTLSTRTGDKEATPSFTTQTLNANYQNAGLNIIGSATYFEFQDLPSMVAFTSLQRGNDRILQNGPNNSRFRYQFKGWVGAFGANYRINDSLEPFGGYSLMQNTKAEDTYDTAQMVEVGNRIHMENHIFSLAYENFFTESDVAPAFYNSFGYGNTNRKGQGIDAYWQFKKHNFRVRAQYYKTNVINDNGIQQDSDYFYLGVESGYDRI